MRLHGVIRQSSSLYSPGISTTDSCFVPFDRFATRLLAQTELPFARLIAAPGELSSLSRRSITTLSPARRGSLRVRVETLLIVTITGALTGSARIRDLGLGGAFLETDRHLEVGDSLHLKIPAGLERFESDAMVRSVTPEGIGVAFVRTTPEDLKVLRRLLTELLE